MEKRLEELERQAEEARLAGDDTNFFHLLDVIDDLRSSSEQNTQTGGDIKSIVITEVKDNVENLRSGLKDVRRWCDQWQDSECDITDWLEIYEMCERAEDILRRMDARKETL